MTSVSATIHATCVAINGAGVLIIGASGSGKSDLALRLIDRGARLIGDDQCLVEIDGQNRVRAVSPPKIAGKIEVRNIGIIEQDHAHSAPIALVVLLHSDPPRMPDRGDSVEIAGRALPRLQLDPNEASAPIKVELALRTATAYGDFMPSAVDTKTVLLVTGLSGAGKSTALDALEDLGWEVVDNLPLSLLDRLLSTPQGSEREGDRPVAIGIDSRTRSFDAGAIVRRMKRLRENAVVAVATLFVDCAGDEIERRYSETRRRHPLAKDRPASDGVARERELLAPLRQAADHIVDTTNLSTSDLQTDIRARFASSGSVRTVLNVMSFGFARGVPRSADIVLDVRYLRNPYWENDLRENNGRDNNVCAYIAADPAYEASLSQIETLLSTILPRFEATGKSYTTVAFGCTGGRHRSVHVAERVAAHLRHCGFSPTVSHRDLADHRMTATASAVKDRIV